MGEERGVTDGTENKTDRVKPPCNKTEMDVLDTNARRENKGEREETLVDAHGLDNHI